MAYKKRVEEEMPDLGNIKIATSVEESLQEVPKMAAKEDVPVRKQAEQVAGEPVNCLRNERIVVKFVPNPNAMIQTKGHVLYGGMAEGATRTFVVPRLRSGQFVNVLTDNEMAFLEQTMRLDKGALGVYNKRDNLWDDNNPECLGKVILHKQNNYLDLNDPIDYIKYKVLLANKDKICPSLQELEDRPKATYQFVIVSENAETQMNLSKNDIKMNCYVEFGAFRNDAHTLRTILEIMSGRPLATNTKIDYLQSKTMDAIEGDPRRFLSVVRDELLPIKVLIKRAVEAGLITRRNDLYYYEGNPMCDMGEDSTLTNAAKYLGNIKRSELKYSLEAKLKE